MATDTINQTTVNDAAMLWRWRGVLDMLELLPEDPFLRCEIIGKIAYIVNTAMDATKQTATGNVY